MLLMLIILCFREKVFQLMMPWILLLVGHIELCEKAILRVIMPVVLISDRDNLHELVRSLVILFIFVKSDYAGWFEKIVTHVISFTIQMAYKLTVRTNEGF